MRRGLDTSVLVYAHVPSLAEHGSVRRYVVGQLTTPVTIVVITAAVLHEFIHVVTDARRFDPPVSMAEALATVRLYLGRSNVECVSTSEAAITKALDLIERYQLGRKRLADTLFAATLIEHGVREIVTCNAGDFSLFEGLSVIDPRSARS